MAPLLAAVQASKWDLVMLIIPERAAMAPPLLSEEHPTNWLSSIVTEESSDQMAPQSSAAAVEVKLLLYTLRVDSSMLMDGRPALPPEIVQSVSVAMLPSIKSNA